MEDPWHLVSLPTWSSGTEKVGRGRKEGKRMKQRIQTREEGKGKKVVCSCVRLPRSRPPRPRFRSLGRYYSLTYMAQRLILSGAASLGLSSYLTLLPPYDALFLTLFLPTLKASRVIVKYWHKLDIFILECPNHPPEQLGHDLFPRVHDIICSRRKKISFNLNF